MPASQTSSDHRFPKSARLLNSAEFRVVFDGEYFAADDVLVVKAIENGLEHSRIGLAVSKKVGNAVVRNRWKRAIRESFRQQRGDYPTNFDFVVRPKRGAQFDYHAIYQSLGKLIARIEKKLERDRKYG